MILPTVTFSTQGAQDARPGALGVEARPVRCGGRAECTSARSLKLGGGREESISPESSRTSAARTLTARAVTKCGVAACNGWPRVPSLGLKERAVCGTQCVCVCTRMAARPRSGACSALEHGDGVRCASHAARCMFRDEKRQALICLHQRLVAAVVADLDVIGRSNDHPCAHSPWARVSCSECSTQGGGCRSTLAAALGVRGADGLEYLVQRLLTGLVLKHLMAAGLAGYSQEARRVLAGCSQGTRRVLAGLVLMHLTAANSSTKSASVQSERRGETDTGPIPLTADPTYTDPT
jgi:hypothetical protein